MSALVTQTRRGRARLRGCESPGGSENARGSGRPESEQSAPTLFEGMGGEPTLDAFVSGVWEGLAAHQRAACPLCGGEMVAAYGAHSHPAEGRCGDCGTTLA